MPSSQQTESGGTGQPDRFRGWSETLKNVVQICAILVAGYWTYYKFIRTEAPSLETRPHVESRLNWNSLPDSKYCNATFTVEIENTGPSSFDVMSVHIRAWRFDPPARASKDSIAEYVDLDKIEKGPTFFDQNFTSTTLIGHFTPGEKGGASYEWIVKRSPNSIAMFSAELEIKGPYGKITPWSSRIDQQTCATATQ